MIQLTPIDKTVVGQELIQMGRLEGHSEGIGKGELIGKIHLAQRLLKHPVTPKKSFLRKTPKEL